MTRCLKGWCAVLFALAVVVAPATAATATPSGEIWEWALGKSPWTDPDLKQYFHPIVPCGSTGQCPGWAQSLDDGWKANPGADSNVVSVELFNDETTLGTLYNSNIAGSGNGSLKHAYKGTLPLGKTWSTTAQDMGAVYGARNMNFGLTPYLGIPITFEYFSNDGRYKFWFEFYAMTAQDLPNARIHKIEVFRGPKWSPAEQLTTSPSG